MKKILLTLCVSLITVVSTYAESPMRKVWNELSNFTYDVSVGMVSCKSSEPYDKSKMGIQFGLDVKRNIKSFKDGKFDTYGLVGFHIQSNGGNTWDKEWTDFDDTKSFTYGEFVIPIHGGFRYNLSKVKLFIDLGPFIGFHTGGSDFDGLETKPIDFGVGVNFGVKFKKVALNMGLSKGFLTVAKYDSDNLKTQSVTLSLVWSFGKK